MLVDLRSGSCIHVHVYNVAHTSSHLQVRLNGSTFTVWDVGGQDKLRPLWRSYTRCTDGIIFVVDSTKEERLEEAKLELQKICKSTVTGTAAGARNKNSIPVLVLANMQVRYTLDSSYLGLRCYDFTFYWIRIRIRNRKKAENLTQDPNSEFKPRIMKPLYVL